MCKLSHHPNVTHTHTHGVEEHITNTAEHDTHICTEQEHCLHHSRYLAHIFIDQNKNNLKVTASRKLFKNTNKSTEAEEEKCVLLPEAGIA